MPNVARRLARLFAQPRIKGLTRTRVYAAVLPIVDDKIRERAARKGVSVSAVRAEIEARAFGYNAATGKRLPKKGK